MNLFHLGLALMMLITGSINTLSVKFADTLKSPSSDGISRSFNHPFLQACGMFLGEMLCMVVFVIIRYRRKKKREADRDGLLTEDPILDAPKFNPFIFLPPALCDMTATSIQYIGLTLTYASSFQMLRGAVIIFTGVLSMFVLRRRLAWFKWFGILFVITGLTTVGVCDLLNQQNKNGNGTDPHPNSTAALFESKEMILMGADNHTSSDILLGDTLIVCAQIIVASQMVYEEKFISKYNVPALQAVGWEGTFGFLTLSTLLIPMYFIPVPERFGDNPRHVLEDAYDGLYQLGHNPLLLGAFCTTILSIAFFNFAGISVTKEMSATTRMVLDSIRTLVIWTVSLAVGWQAFYALQLLGFALLVFGMCIYNDILIGPACRKLKERFQNRYQGLEEDDDSEHEAERSTNVFDPRHQEINS